MVSRGEEPEEPTFRIWLRQVKVNVGYIPFQFLLSHAVLKTTLNFSFLIYHMVTVVSNGNNSVKWRQ